MVQHRHIRHGAGSVRPYLYGNLDLADLIKRAFDAEELERLPTPGGFHIEARIGDSMVVLEVGNFPAHVKPTPAPSMCMSPTSTKPTDAPWKRARLRSRLQRTSPTRSARRTWHTPRRYRW